MIALAGLARSSFCDEPAPAEEETRRINARLDNLLRDLPTLKNITAKNGIGDQSQESKNIFAAAVDFFEKKEFLSASREIQRYLNQLQTIDSQDYLKAQFILGECFEDQGQNSRALRSYLRYINAFLTSPTKDFSELTEVLRRLFQLASSQSTLTKEETAKLISALGSQDIPGDSKAEFYYLAAKLSASIGVTNLANQWIEKSGHLDSNSSTALRSLYYQALLLSSFGDVTKAYKLLDGLANKISEIEKTQRSQDEFNSRSVYLALARTSVKLKKPQTGLTHYEHIIANKIHDSIYQEALFESVFLYANLEDFESARDNAQSFLKEFSGGRRAFQLKNIVMYFAINAGDLNSAQAQLQANIAEIMSIKKTINQHFRNLADVNYSEIFALNQLTYSWVQQPFLITKGLKLFAELEEYLFQTFENKAAAKNILYSVANNSLQSLNPQWSLTYEHLKQASVELMDTGSRLSAIQRAVFSEQLTDVEKSLIDHSTERRVKLVSARASEFRELHARRYLLKSMKISLKYGAMQKKLETLRAEAANINFLKHSTNTDYSQKLDDLSDKVAANLNHLKKQDLRQKVAMEKFHGIKKLFTLYSQNLKDESTAVSDVEKNIQTHMAKIQWDELQFSWKKWDDSAVLWLRTFNDFEHQVQKDLAEYLVTTDRYEQEALRTEESVSAREADLETLLGNQIGTVSDQLEFQLNSRLENYRKWLADIEYMKFEMLSQDKAVLEKNKNLKLQILKDQLRDLEQGIL